MTKPSPFLIHGALMLVSIFYGATFSIAKEVMPEYIGSSGFILIRVWVATLLLTLVHIIFIREKIKQTDLARLAVAGLFGVVTNQLTFFKGLSMTSPVNASLIATAGPLLVLMAGVMVGEERFTWLKLTGVLTGAVGAGLLIWGPGIDVGAANWKGDLLVLANVTAYAVYLTLVQPLMQKYHPITVIRWAFTFGAIFVAPFGLPQAWNARWSAMPGEVWASIAFVVICTTFLAYLLNAWAMRYVKASVVGTYIYLQPFWAIIIAVLLAGYLLDVQQLLYGALILAGVFLVTRGQKRT